MNFDFIPFQLNSDIASFKGQIDFISSNNGVELYKVRMSCIEPILGFKVSKVNLYFFEGNLVTVYIRLLGNIESIQKIIAVLNTTILKTGKTIETTSDRVHYWQGRSQFLGLLNKEGMKYFLIYHTLNEYNIYNP